MFVETGAWLRAQYYPRAGEKDWLETVNREVTRDARAASACATSRPSARSRSRARTPAIFLDRVYTNTFSTLAGRQGALRR